MTAKNIYEIIDNLRVAAYWKDTFKKIHCSFYNNYYQGKANNIHLWSYSEALKNLPFMDRFKFFTRFNFLGLILGPIYYLIKFMFVKGLVLLAIELALIYYFGTPIAYYAILLHVYTAIFFNTDYFSSKVLNNKKIKTNPELLNDYVNEYYCNGVVKRANIFYPFLAIMIVIAGFLGYFVYENVIKELQYDRIIARTEKVCNDSIECDALVKKSHNNIKNGKGHPYIEYYNLGAAYLELGSVTNALNALAFSTKKNPDFLPPYLLKASIFMDKKMYSFARANYEMALSTYPKGKFLNYNIGTTYYKQSNYKAARTYFQEAVAAYPNNAQFLEALAYTKIYLKDNKSAKTDLIKVEKILKKHPKKNEYKIEAIENYIRKM